MININTVVNCWWGVAEKGVEKALGLECMRIRHTDGQLVMWNFDLVGTIKSVSPDITDVPTPNSSPTGHSNVYVYQSNLVL